MGKLKETIVLLFFRTLRFNAGNNNNFIINNSNILITPSHAQE